ncbi:unnamed protein product [Triticum turgidum subsp. durum]|uniref:Uncharacterized protein n=1 Tax=Triticum turgidum subsp. durum TaxID=4567 RepID=A0A9R0ZET6_TRITD|nr:unnamed protein product [Triticum turgidum subsp. durum]
MGGGSGQTNAPCGDIYARECVVAVHHNNNLCCVDFRFFGDELDYIPLKATYPAHERVPPTSYWIRVFCTGFLWRILEETKSFFKMMFFKL